MLAPLDTIPYLWRAQTPVNGAIPNDGIQQPDAPLVLGPTTGLDPEDPLFQSDPDRLEIRPWSSTDPVEFAQAVIPVAELNGDFSMFIQVTPLKNAADLSGLWYTHQPLWYMIDNPESTTDPQKRVFTYINTSAKEQFRIFKTTGDTVDLIGNGLAASVGQKVTYGFSFESSTKTMRCYRNGVPTGSVVMPEGAVRSTVGVGLLRLCSPTPTPSGSTPKANYNFHAGGFKHGTIWSDADFAALGDALDDYLENGGSPPPPPPPPGVVKYSLDEVEVPSLTITDNGTPLVFNPPPTGERWIRVSQ